MLHWKYVYFVTQLTAVTYIYTYIFCPYILHEYSKLDNRLAVSLDCSQPSIRSLNTRTPARQRKTGSLIGYSLFDSHRSPSRLHPAGFALASLALSFTCVEK